MIWAIRVLLILGFRIISRAIDPTSESITCCGVRCFVTNSCWQLLVNLVRIAMGITRSWSIELCWRYDHWRIGVPYWKIRVWCLIYHLTLLVELSSIRLMTVS
ncbi:uncharacterized protein EI90DRAFT_3047064 [Cantharellus anzutake]|uniref:uncharacterized protein n=1 Tax=Cantharellus anzutake TaxID=1750568 RepID=UPI001908A01A|nr:uncharacterized protein EI90DRAFT_3047064 [Cantharellus anzutake]KAF8335764.1 hypothetical protein EI90DRAFT_3047064 [Cantharellus anzutake]